MRPKRHFALRRHFSNGNHSKNKNPKKSQNFQNFAKASVFFFFFDSPPQQSSQKKSPQILRPWDFNFLWNLRPPNLKMDQILHQWDSEMSKISLPERSKKIFSPLKSWFCTKKRAKNFRPPSAAEFFSYIRRIFLTPKSYPQILPPWDSKNLWILHPRVEEGNQKKTRRLREKRGVHFFCLRR